MKTHSYIRNVLVACAIVAFFAAQLTSGTLPTGATHHNLRASHHSVVRHESHRRVNANSFVSVLPACEAGDPIRRISADIPPFVRLPALRQPARSCPARSPPLS